LVESVRTARGPRQQVVAYLGKLDEAGRLGAALAASGVAMPAAHVVKEMVVPAPIKVKVAAPEPEPEPEAGPTPKSGAAPAKPAGMTAEQGRQLDAANKMQKEAAALLLEVQNGIKGGQTGLKPKADRADELLGKAIDTCGKIQDDLDARGVKIPLEVSQSLQRATETRKLLRSVRMEVK
jgi:hypothetical protein